MATEADNERVRSFQLALRRYAPFRAVLDEVTADAGSASAFPDGSRDEQYFALVDLTFMARYYEHEILHELSVKGTKLDADSGAAERKGVLFEATSAASDLASKCIDAKDRRLSATRAAGKLLPRGARAAAAYDLTSREADLLHFMAVVQGSAAPAVRAGLTDDDAHRRTYSLARLVRMSEVELEYFQDETRAHVKEGILVVVDDDNANWGGAGAMRLSAPAVRAMRGAKLSEDDWIKLQDTKLERVLEEEGLSPEKDAAGAAAPSPSPAKRRAKRQRSSSPPASPRAAASPEKAGDSDGEAADAAPAAPAAAAPAGTTPVRPGNFDAYSSDNQLDYLEDCFQALGLQIRAAAARMKDEMRKEGTRMTNYWGDYDGSGAFTARGGGGANSRRELEVKLRAARARIRKRLAATERCGGAMPRLEAMARRLGLHPFEKEVLVLLIGKTVSPVITRLREDLSTSASVPMEDTLSVGQILIIFCPSFAEQVAHRQHFYSSGRLISRGLVRVTRPRWHAGSGDLTELRVALDRRVLDHIVGLDTEVSELVQGSDLYTPSVTMDQLVLPERVKAQLLRLCGSFKDFRAYRRRQEGLRTALPYGAALCVLLCGASGTGKTMTVNALAGYLGKKVLLVDFPSLMGRKGDAPGGSMDADLRGLFREAEMSNALLFFDECEMMFRERDQGGDRLLNALLTEIERYEGICFMATNRPFDLDEAMHRRITAVVEFRPPDAPMRREIWTRLCRRGAVRVAEDVDWDLIALKYELTGGFIKNAVLSAILLALSRNRAGPPAPEAAGADPLLREEEALRDAGAEDPTVTMSDLVAGCILQMRGSLQSRGAQDIRYVPEVPTSGLVLGREAAEGIRRFIVLEKARGTVHGSWAALPEGGAAGAASAAGSSTGGTSPRQGTGEARASQESAEPLGLTVGASSGRAGAPRRGLAQRAGLALLVGPKGAGKRTVSSAIAADLGRPVKVLQAASLQPSQLNGLAAPRRLEGALKDARLLDAVLVIEDVQHLLGAESGSMGSERGEVGLTAGRILDTLEEFPGAVVLCASVEDPRSLQLNPEFSRRLSMILPLGIPEAEQRARLWRQLMPPRAPLAKDVDLQRLGARFEMLPCTIGASIYAAAAEAASRSGEERVISQADLENAALHEEKRLYGASQFVRGIFV